jgi:hypothetical protein
MASPKLRKLNKLLKRRRVAASDLPQDESTETMAPEPEAEKLDELVAVPLKEKSTKTMAAKTKKRVKKTVKYDE